MAASGLALLNEDLTERFAVSPTLCSYIFTNWILLLSRILDKALVVWPRKESKTENLPEIFLKSGYGKYFIIIEYAEVFTERPKSLSAKPTTWWDYKHHNTFRFLVGITPTVFISFLSACCGSRTSDKSVTRNSGF